jgi:NTE family protein
VSNLDLLAGRGLDLVICLNPTSSRKPPSSLNPIDRLWQMTRAANGRRLGREAKKVRGYGTEVVIIEPGDEDLAVMGKNLMSGQRRHEMIETAARTVAKRLRSPELREKLKGLPEGEPHKLRRPPGPPSTWPRIVPAAKRRAA